MKETDPIETLLLKKSQKTLLALDNLNIKTIYDLLYHFPARYENPAITFTGELTKGETISLEGKITSISMRKSMGKRRVMIAEASIKTTKGNVKAIWFSQPYIAKQYSKNNYVRISGKVASGKTKYLTNPNIKHIKSIESQEDKNENEKLIPIYPETYGISSRWLSSYIQKALSKISKEGMPDLIPENVRKKLSLPHIIDALQYIHFPRNDAETESAKKRFIFEAVFVLQIKQQYTKKIRKSKKAYNISVNKKSTDSFIKKQFPFTPTKDQKNAIEKILKDINSNQPMSRLLEGDVGSGKTAVAASVMHGVINATPEEKTSGKPQVAYLAPTEVLARQQFNTLIELFKDLPVQIGFISSKECLKFPSKINKAKSTKISKPQLKKWVTTGELAIVVGTHALIQKDVVFKRLALVIIDEQHRFGVTQRQHLFSNTNTHVPHLLSMTATPIPRTHALTIYGDLQLTLIKELPKGRKTVKTKLLTHKDILKAYKHIRKEVEDGKQAYILCPRVLETNNSNLRSIEEEYKHLSKEIFPDLKIDILHGQMKQKQKQETIKKFLAKEVDILISTTVIEVGVNILNATIIIILHAECFGLAQLHQLRGRVIRSTHQSYCYPVTNNKNEFTLERLKYFEKTHNGFELAEKDFETRGSGELVGTKQSGIPDLAMEGIKNKKLVPLAQNAAKEIIEKDPRLEKHINLQKEVLKKKIHNE